MQSSAIDDIEIKHTAHTREGFALGAVMVAEWIRGFCRLQPVPLTAAVRIDADRQLLFVQQHAPDPVNQLLDEWGLDKGSAERKSYARLGEHSLIQLVVLPGALGPRPILPHSRGDELPPNCRVGIGDDRPLQGFR